MSVLKQGNGGTERLADQPEITQPHSEPMHHTDKW